MSNIELCGQTLDLDNLQSSYFCMDCMEGMKKFPDKYFDLAVVDPPYGIGMSGGTIGGGWRRHRLEIINILLGMMLNRLNVSISQS